MGGSTGGESEEAAVPLGALSFALGWSVMAGGRTGVGSRSDGRRDDGRWPRSGLSDRSACGDDGSQGFLSRGTDDETLKRLDSECDGGCCSKQVMTLVRGQVRRRRRELADNGRDPLRYRNWGETLKRRCSRGSTCQKRHNSAPPVFVVGFRGWAQQASETRGGIGTWRALENHRERVLIGWWTQSCGMAPVVVVSESPGP